MSEAPSTPVFGTALQRFRSLRFWMACVLVMLVLAIVGTAGGSFFETRRVVRADAEMRDRLRPAQVAIQEIATSYVDQETGEQGFLLTGDTAFLDSYTAGEGRATQLQSMIANLLHSYVQAPQLLHAVAVAGSAWQTDSAVPAIAARELGPVDPDQTLQMAKLGGVLFNTLRASVAALSARIAALIAVQIDRLNRSQADVARTTSVELTLAVGAAALCLVLLRTMFTRPLKRLVDQVRAVAGGAYDQQIDSRGPQELAVLGNAVDRMRTSLLDGSADLLVAQRLLTVREERSRMAADLHDRTIQRVYALGMSLGSLARANPQVASQAETLMDDTDSIIRELRGIIFAINTDSKSLRLRNSVTGLAQDSGRTLGFTPALTFKGPIDIASTTQAADALMAVLREAISNIARHAKATSAEVTVAATIGPQPTLHLTVSDDGIGPGAECRKGSGIANIEERAKLLGGSATVLPGDLHGTVIEWDVPIK